MAKINGLVIFGAILLIVAASVFVQSSRKSASCDTVFGNVGMALGVGDCYKYKSSGTSELGVLAAIGGIICLIIGISKMQSTKAETIHTEPSQQENKSQKFCGECGAKINKGVKFCSECGARR